MGPWFDGWLVDGGGPYSEASRKYLRRERRRSIVRRCRQSLLALVLLVICLWGYSNYRADNFTFAWTRPVRVLVIAVLDPRTDDAGDATQGLLQRFLAGPIPSLWNLAGVERWFREEFERHTGRREAPLEFTARGPLRAPAPPPPSPSAQASFLDRWRGTRAFLEYFQSLGGQEDLVPEAYDAVLFVYFFEETERDRYAGHHSVAWRRNRRGVVFSPLGPEHMERCSVLLAHELCHTLGASDKYRGEESLYPEGFAHPDQRPLYPQESAEVMALGIPVAPGVERRVEDLSDCRMGRKTAEEIGWRRAPR